MSEVTKIATRVSYGNALVELAKEHDDVYVVDADLAAATQTAIFKKVCLKKNSRSVTLTVVSQNVT